MIELINQKKEISKNLTVSLNRFFRKKDTKGTFCLKGISKKQKSEITY